MNEQFQTLIANSRLAFIQGKYQEALDFAKEAIENEPDNADAWYIYSFINWRLSINCIQKKKKS